MNQQPPMSYSTTNYGAPQPPQWQQEQQPTSMYPSQTSAATDSLTSQVNKIPPNMQSPPQYYYQQQSKSLPVYDAPNAGRNGLTAPKNTSNNVDLNNQMSNLSLDGENRAAQSSAASYSSVSNDYSNNYPNTFANQSIPSPSNTFQSPSTATSQIFQNAPPTAQAISSNGVQATSNYSSQQPQPMSQNYNFPQQQQVGVHENWNQNPYSGVKSEQPTYPATNFGIYGQNQQNGQMQNYQQAPAPPPSNYQVNQQQPPIPSMNQNFGSQSPNQAPLNRYPSQSGPSNYGGQFPSANQQNRLDPEGMPSVVQVILEDKTKYESNNNVLFTTTVPASVPPLVTTIMENDIQVVEDGGSARPIFLRPTIFQVPSVEDNLKASDIPLGLVIKPFDDQEVEGKIYVPVSNSEIVRCNRCKSYMNPYNRFVDCGRRFQCSLCKHVTEVPASYFANLDHTGQRLDKYQRPELFLGSYEFRATEEFCRNSIMNNRRPHIIFACELTETSKPILHYLANNLAEIIQNFPKDPLNQNSLPPMVGFVTYNSKIQLYDIMNSGHAHVVCDLSTPFPPLNTFLVDPLIHINKIESFLKSLPSLYENETLEMQTILGPMIEAALMTTQVDVHNWFNEELANKASNDIQQNQTYDTIPVGKIYIFHCTLPTYGNDADTPGRLKPRWTNSIDEIRKLLGTDKEKAILSPETNKYYLGLGQKCVKDFASGIELFLFPPINGSFLDIATLGELARLSGTGAIFKYFNDYSDAFLTDLKYSLNSSFAFDCILKVRTSTGIRPHDYYGNFHLSLPNDIECAALNTSSNLVVDFKYDDKLPEDEHVIIQVAVLYTSLSGERRVRLHNLALATCQQISDIYRNSCCDTIVNLIARSAVYNLRKGDKTILQTKEAIINRVINILTSYRRHCANPGTSLGQLILPESLKLLPVYTCGLLKCDAIDGGPEMNPDDKAYAQLKLLSSYPSLSQVFLYPRLYKIEYEDSNEENLKYTQIRCSSYKLNSPALGYLLENGFYLLFLITTSGCANVKFLTSLFGNGVDSVNKIQIDSGLPNLLTNESQSMTRFLKKIESERKCSYKLFIIRQGIDKIESVFRSFLFEDSKIVTRNAGESKLEGLSYVDLLCHLHKEIRTQLN